jgi:RNase H-fold protein (predicted Holliday junction resolvase)
MQTNSSPNVILAIAPGKRELGIAVFVGADLVSASVKTIRRRKSRKLLLREIAVILRQLFEEFSITIVVIKAITQYQKLSPDLKRIAERIKLEADQKDLQVIGITLEQIKSVLSKDEKATEKKAFETLIEDYPQLEKYWNRPNKWQNDYYAFLFSAVAVGAVYLKTLYKIK